MQVVDYEFRLVMEKIENTTMLDLIWIDMRIKVPTAQSEVQESRYGMMYRADQSRTTSGSPYCGSSGIVVDLGQYERLGLIRRYTRIEERQDRWSPL